MLRYLQVAPGPAENPNVSFTVSLPRNGSEEKSHSSVSSEDTSSSTSSESSEEAGSSEDQEAGDEEWEWEEEEEAKATVSGAVGTAKQVSSKQDCAETDGPVLTHLQETFNVLSGAYKIITGRSTR